MHARAAELIDRLQLAPHPEGGFYREVYRSPDRVQPLDDLRDARSALTTILFLLTDGMHSRWHRVASDEVWHFYEGAPLELFVAAPDVASVERVVLGPALVTDGPVFTVPSFRWQAARPLGAFAFVGCTVAPGFDFADFSFLRDHPSALSEIRRIDPRLADLA
jgi:predicted cupin superfamily sugar epimerase